MRTILDVIYYNLMNGYEYGEQWKDSNNVSYFHSVLYHSWSKGKEYFSYEHYGSSAIKTDKRELKWLLDTIYKMTPYEFVQKYQVYDPRMKTLADIQDMIRYAEYEKAEGLCPSFEIPKEMITCGQ